jgi:hypothetical protein
MNKNLQIVIGLGASIVLLMLLFPPFHLEMKGITLNRGYSFIFDPPMDGTIPASVNIRLLMVQWVGIVLVTGSAFYIVKSSYQLKKRDSD